MNTSRAQTERLEISCSVDTHPVIVDTPCYIIYLYLLFNFNFDFNFILLYSSRWDFASYITLLLFHESCMSIITIIIHIVRYIFVSSLQFILFLCNLANKQQTNNKQTTNKQQTNNKQTTNKKNKKNKGKKKKKKQTAIRLI